MATTITTTTTTTITAPMESNRAQEILQDLRRKRESFVSSNPSLQKHHLRTSETTKKNKNEQHAKPPLSRKSKRSKSKSRSSQDDDDDDDINDSHKIHKKEQRGAQEILGDMKRKRDALTAVLESCRHPGSPSRRSARSVGVSTAPTAASTRSWISSVADEGSFCYSETSLEEADSPKGSSIEFIIDTEESDLCSLSTREEVKQAIDQIYNEVVPKALHAIQEDARIASSFPQGHASSWVFRSQSSARDLYREESVKIRVSEKKQRRVRIEERRDSVYERISSTRSDTSFASSTSSIDIREVRKQRAVLKSMLDSVSELNQSSAAAAGPAKERRRHTSSRRPRQDDTSDGSSPISKTKSSLSSSSSARSAPSRSLSPVDETQIDFDLSLLEKKSPKKKKKNKINFSSSSSSSAQSAPFRSLSPVKETPIDFDLSLFEKKSHKKNKKNSNSSIASHYVIGTKRRGKKTKKVVVRQQERYVAPSPDPENMAFSVDLSDASPLVSPALSSASQASPLVTPPDQSVHSKAMPSHELSSDSVKDDEPIPAAAAAVSKDCENTTLSSRVSGRRLEKAPPQDETRRVSQDEERRREKIPEIITAPCMDVLSEVSELHVFQDHSKETEDDGSPVIKNSKTLISLLAQASERNPVVIPLAAQQQLQQHLQQQLQQQQQEPTPDEPESDYLPQEYMKTTFVMEDIIREMNLMSQRIGKNGLQIPSGTVLKLRHYGPSQTNVDVDEPSDSESTSGWTFMEPSDVSSCSCTAAAAAAPSSCCRGVSRFIPDEGSDEAPQLLLERQRQLLLLPSTTTPHPPVAEQDIAERFCGGLYHLAVLSGMPSYDEFGEI